MPPQVPFRLTRMMIKAMEVSGIEGNFRTTVSNTLSSQVSGCRPGRALLLLLTCSRESTRLKGQGLTPPRRTPFAATTEK